MEELEKLAPEDQYYVTLQELGRRGELSDDEQTTLETLRNRRTTYSRADLHGELGDLDVDNISPEVADRYNNLWASTMTMGSFDLETAGTTTPFTADQIFQQHKDPISKLKYIKGQIGDEKYRIETSPLYKYQKMDRAGKLEFAKEYGKEVFNKLPARENVPQSFWAQMFLATGDSPRMDMMSDKSYLERLEAVGIDPEDPEHQMGLTTPEREDALMRRVNNKLLEKDLAAKRQIFDSRLSEESAEWSKVTADTGVFNIITLSLLPKEEQELASRYAFLLRGYSDSGRLSQWFQEAGSSIADTAENVLDFSVKGLVGLNSIYDPKGTGQVLLADDEKQRLEGLEKVATRTKFDEFDGSITDNLWEGSMTFARSLPYMILAAKSLPLSVARGYMAMAAYAQEANANMVATGADPDTAQVIAPFIGLGMHQFEKFNDIFDVTPAMKQTIARNFRTMILQKSAGFAKRGGDLVWKETVEEVGQGFTEAVPTQLITEGKVDNTKLLGMVAETVEEMIKAGPSFFLSSEFTRGGATMIDKMGIGEADLQATDMIKRMDSFEEGIDAPPLSVEEVLDKMPVDETVEDLQGRLKKLGVAEPKKVAKRLKRLQREDLTRKFELYQEHQTQLAQLVENEEAFKGFKTKLEETGFSVNEVEAITGAISELAVGSLDETTIEVRNNLFDKVGIARHEVFHKFLEDYGVEQGLLSDQEMQLLRSSTDKIVGMLQEAGLDTTNIYDNYSRGKQTNEILADAGAVLNPQELTVWQKAVDLYERIANFLKGDGFESVRSILKKVEQRGFEAAPKLVAEENQRIAARNKFMQELEARGRDTGTRIAETIQGVTGELDQDIEAQIAELESGAITLDEIEAEAGRREVLRAILERRRQQPDRTLEEDAKALEDLELQELSTIEDINAEIEAEISRIDAMEQMIDERVAKLTEEREGRKAVSKNDVKVARTLIPMNKFFEANKSLDDPRFVAANPYEISDFEEAIRTNNPEEIRKAFIPLKKQMVKWNKLTEETKEHRAGRKLMEGGIPSPVEQVATDAQEEQAEDQRGDAEYLENLRKLAEEPTGVRTPEESTALDEDLDAFLAEMDVSVKQIDELSRLGKLERIEKKINEEYANGEEIEKLLIVFYGNANKTEADQDANFREIYANDYRSLANAIKSNIPDRVKKSTIRLRDDMRKWDSMRDSTKQNLIDRAGRFAQRNVLPPTVEIDGKPRPTVNSEGQQIAPTEEMVKNFWNWFGKSAVVDEEGRPLVVFHGTTHEFWEFKRDRGNTEGDWGKGFYFSTSEDDVNANYVGTGPDLTSRIDRRVEDILQDIEDDIDGAIDRLGELPELVQYKKWQDGLIENAPALTGLATEIATEELSGGTERMLSVYLRMENPFVVSSGKTPINDYLDYEYDEDTGEETGSLLDFIETVREVGMEWSLYNVDELVSEIMQDGETDMQSAIEVLRQSEAMNPDTGEFASNEFAREVVERAGYDGIIDLDVNRKFGAGRQFGRPMSGIYSDTAHYIAFKSEDIKSATENEGAFDAADPDIRKGQRNIANTLENAAEAYALAKLAGRNPQVALERLAKVSGLDPAEIEQAGEEVAEDAEKQLDVTADAFQQRLAIRKASLERVTYSKLKEARKQGFKLGESGALGEVNLAKMAETRVERDKRANDGIPATRVARDHKTDINLLIHMGGDPVQVLVDLANETVKSKDEAVQLHHVKRTLSKSLKKSARGLVSGKIRQGQERVDTSVQADRIDEAKTLDAAIKQANAVVERIRQNMVKRNMDELRIEFGKTLKPYGKKISEKERETKGKISKPNRLALKYAKTYWGLSGEKYNQAKAELNARIEAFGRVEETPEVAREKAEIQAQLYAVRMVDMAREAETVGQLEDAISAVNRLIAEGFVRLQAKKEKINTRNKADRDAFIEDLKTQRKGKKPIDPDKKIFLDTFVNPIDALNAMVAGTGEAVAKELQSEADTTWNLAKTEILELRDKAEVEIKKLGFSSLASFMRQLRKETKGMDKFSNEGRTRLTRAHGLKILFQLEREDIATKHEKNEHIQRRLGQMEELRKVFTPEELAGATMLRDMGEQVYLSIFEQVEEATGLPPTFVPNYFPLTWNREAPGGTGYVSLVADLPGFLIPTVSHKHDLDETNGDFFDLLFNHIDELVLYKHSDNLKTRMKGGILSAQVLEEIRKTYGAKARDLFNHQMTDMIAHRALLKGSEVSRSLSDEVWGYARAGAAYTSLMGRIPSMFRQLFDLGSFMLTVDMKTAKRVYERMATAQGVKDAVKFSQHPLMKERMRGRIDEGSANILDKIDLLPSETLRKALTGLMRVPGFGDVFSFSLVGAQMTDILLNSDPKYKYMSEKDAYNAAVAETVGVLERVYQSTEVKDLSPEIRDASEFKRGFTQFLTADLAKLSKEIMSYRKWKGGAKDGGKQLAKVMFINHVLLPLPQLAISFFFQNVLRGEDFDEDEYAEIAMHVLAGPFRGAAMIGTVMFAMGNAFSSFNTPAQNLAGNVIGATMAIKDTDWGDSDDIMKLLDKWMKMIGSYRDVRDIQNFMKEMD